MTDENQLTKTQTNEAFAIAMRIGTCRPGGFEEVGEIYSELKKRKGELEFKYSPGEKRTIYSEPTADGEIVFLQLNPGDKIRMTPEDSRAYLETHRTEIIEKVIVARITELERNHDMAGLLQIACNFNAMELSSGFKSTLISAINVVRAFALECGDLNSVHMLHDAIANDWLTALNDSTLVIMGRETAVAFNIVKKAHELHREFWPTRPMPADVLSNGTVPAPGCGCGGRCKQPGPAERRPMPRRMLL
ncbi:MAG: hypothetical protein WCT31_01540 [Candidatus Micrarchaeia archaeon]|jgi:hypothetical protein